MNQITRAAFGCPARKGGDVYSDYNGAPSDGSAWEDPIGIGRVRRGGSFTQGASYLRASHRNSGDPLVGDDHLGCRCSR